MKMLYSKFLYVISNISITAPTSVWHRCLCIVIGWIGWLDGGHSNNYQLTQ